MVTLQRMRRKYSKAIGRKKDRYKRKTGNDTVRSGVSCRGNMGSWGLEVVEY